MVTIWKKFSFFIRNLVNIPLNFVEPKLRGKSLVWPFMWINRIHKKKIRKWQPDSTRTKDSGGLFASKDSYYPSIPTNTSSYGAECGTWTHDAGFEIQSLNQLNEFCMVAQLGIEPRTCRLWDYRAATALLRDIYKRASSYNRQDRSKF